MGSNIKKKKILFSSLFSPHLVAPSLGKSWNFLAHHASFFGYTKLVNLLLYG